MGKFAKRNMLDVLPENIAKEYNINKDLNQENLQICYEDEKYIVFLAKKSEEILEIDEEYMLCQCYCEDLNSEADFRITFLSAEMITAMKSLVDKEIEHGQEKVQIEDNDQEDWEQEEDEWEQEY